MQKELEQLIESFKDDIKAFVSDTKDEYLTVQYETYICRSITFDKGGIRSNGGMSFNESKNHIKYPTVREFVKKEIVKNPKFNIFLQKANKSWSKSMALSYLAELVDGYIAANYFKTRPKTTIKNISNHLIEKYCSRTLNFDYQVWMNSLTVPDKKFKIDFTKGIVIRKPNENDFHVVRQKTYYKYQKNPVLHNSTSVLQFNIDYDRNDLENLFKEYGQVINVLRLFKVVSIEPIKYSRLIKNQFIGNYENQVFEKPKSGFFRAEIKEDEIPELKKFYKAISSKLPVSYDNKIHASSSKEFEVGFQFYTMALINKEERIARVAYLISCLESILSDDVSELKFRISLFVSYLLTKFGFNSLEVKDVVGKCYNSRSRYYHGAPLGKKAQNSLPEDLRKLAEYTRCCLIIVYQLIDNYKDKKEMSLNITNSLVSETEKKTLDKNLKKVKIYGC